MNKGVLISIQPQWCEKIFNGEKTIEVRRTRPKIETPFKSYIYCTALKDKKRYTDEFDVGAGKWIGNSRVIGEFVCDRIVELKINGDDCGNYWLEWNDECDIEDMCLSYEELETYLGKFVGYGWHISDLKIYDKPKELVEFKKAGFMTEEQWLCALYPNTHCHYEAWAKRFEIKHPPQSWMFCEEIDEE